MKTDDHKVEEVLKESRRFLVPIYQRQYQWRDDRLSAFWEDVSAKAGEDLDGESRFEHYMGALILLPVKQDRVIGVTPLVQVVDGQQRLTTFLIFLAALREVAREWKLDHFIKSVEGYLYNNTGTGDDDPKIAKYKLTPTYFDRAIFYDIMDMEYADAKEKHSGLFYGERVPMNCSSRAFRAYFIFRFWITEFAKTGPDTGGEIDLEGDEDSALKNDEVDIKVVEERLTALFSALLTRMKLVVITLGEEDDAQVIFESLNSKGEPLLAMDLVRNNIFHRAGNQGDEVENLYEEFWKEFDGEWWKEKAPNASPSRPRLDHFLAHILTAEFRKGVSVRELYAEYRAFSTPRGTPRFDNIEEELELLQSYVKPYEALERRNNKNKKLSWLGGKLAIWQVTTAYPVAMQIARADIADGEKQTLYKLIYSFIVRRQFCGLTAKNYNKVFQDLADDFRENISVKTFRDFFDKKSGGKSTNFPSNKELQDGILKVQAYKFITQKSRLVDILWELEVASRTKKTPSLILEKGEALTVEHVLPQKWRTDWPFADEAISHHEADDPRAIERNRTIQTLGNLTLLTGLLNSVVGNSSFENKKAELEEHDNLFLNKWFEDEDKWDEEEIEKRGKHFANLAKKIWIGLDETP